MMGEAELGKLAADTGIPPDKKEGTGRPLGASIGKPNLKTMGKKDLQAELGKARKKLKDLEDEAQGISKAGPGSGAELPRLPVEMWAVLPCVFHEYLAVRYGKHWILKEMEVTAYGQAVEKVVDRYLGAIAGDYPELFALGMVMAGTMVPRVIITMKAKAAPPPPPDEKKPKEEKKKK